MLFARASGGFQQGVHLGKSASEFGVAQAELLQAVLDPITGQVHIHPDGTLVIGALYGVISMPDIAD